MKWAAKDPVVPGTEHLAAHREHRPDLYGPMVCTCQTPVADPHVDSGMCQTCGRKPLGLMKPKGAVRWRR